MPLPLSTSPELAAQAYVLSWLDLLAQSRWHEAVALLDEPNAYGIIWSETDIRRIIFEYSKGKAIEITSPRELVTPPHFETGAFNDGSGFWLDCLLPLNGEWSDLTVQFEFKVRGELYAASLHDIHVL